MSNASKGPTILITINAGCVDISEWQFSKDISAILYQSYGGMYGGLGLSDVLFGNFAPVGRLTQTWYYEKYLNQVSMFDMHAVRFVSFAHLINLLRPARSGRCGR